MVFFSDGLCFAEYTIFMDYYFITNFVILVHPFIISTCDAAMTGMKC